MQKILHRLAFPFCYLAGVIIMLYFLPSMIRDLREEEKSRTRYYT